MKVRFGVLCAMELVVVAAVLAAADAPYMGTWKLNPAQSQLTGETMVIEKAPDGFFHLRQGDVGYTFMLDGMEYPTADGGTTSWKAVDANTWEGTNRVKGKVTITIRASLNGNTMSNAFRLIKADGGTFEESDTLTRISGGPAFLGKWKTTKLNVAVFTIVLEAHGANGIVLKWPDQGFVCNAKFDGVDYPVTGPQSGGKATYSLKKTGSRSFDVTEKLDGKPVSFDKYIVSEDGKTLTMEDTPASEKEITKAVFERQ